MDEKTVPCVGVKRTGTEIGLKLDNGELKNNYGGISAASATANKGAEDIVTALTALKR